MAIRGTERTRNKHPPSLFGHPASGSNGERATGVGASCGSASSSPLALPRSTTITWLGFFSRSRNTNRKTRCNCWTFFAPDRVSPRRPKFRSVLLDFWCFQIHEAVLHVFVGETSNTVEQRIAITQPKKRDTPSVIRAADLTGHQLGSYSGCWQTQRHFWYQNS